MFKRAERVVWRGFISRALLRWRHYRVSSYPAQLPRHRFSVAAGIIAFSELGGSRSACERLSALSKSARPTHTPCFSKSFPN